METITYDVKPLEPPRPVNWDSISEVQRFITKWAERTFTHRSDHHVIYKLMVHEIPEMMTHKMEHGLDGIGEELADAFILLMDLASLWKVDLAQAIEDKMLVNIYRVWEQDEHGIMQHVHNTPVHVVTKEEEALGTDAVGTYPCIVCHSMDHLEKLTGEEMAVLTARDGECYDNTRCTACRITYDSTVPF